MRRHTHSKPILTSEKGNANSLQSLSPGHLLPHYNAVRFFGGFPTLIMRQHDPQSPVAVPTPRATLLRRMIDSPPSPRHYGRDDSRGSQTTWPQRRRNRSSEFMLAEEILCLNNVIVNVLFWNSIFPYFRRKII